MEEGVVWGGRGVNLGGGRKSGVWKADVDACVNFEYLLLVLASDLQIFCRKEMEL